MAQYGLTLHEIGSFSEALDALERAETIQSDHRRFEVQLAKSEIFERRSAYPEALVALRNAMDCCKVDSREKLAWKEVVLRLKMEDEGVLGKLKEMPLNSETYAARCILLTQRKRFAEVVELTKEWAKSPAGYVEALCDTLAGRA